MSAAAEPSVAPPLVAAQGVSVRRGRRTVVSDVDLAVHAGEVVALLGPNGAGKSSLLGALAGDLPVAAGRVLVGGRPLAEVGAGELSRRRAVLPQHITVAFPFTVDQVVRMGRAPWSRHTNAADDDAAVAAALDECEVAHLAGRPYPALSGGEQARVSLARVLAQGTDLVLLDEPTAALDVRHQAGLFATLRARVARGLGAVVVLHDLTAAAAHADRVVLLGEGRVLADGPPAQALRPDLLRVAYEHELEVFASPTTGALAVVPLPRGTS